MAKTEPQAPARQRKPRAQSAPPIRGRSVSPIRKLRSQLMSFVSSLPRLPHIMEDLQRRFDPILSALCFQVEKCLKEFDDTNTSAWATDLKQMHTILVPWSLDNDDTEPAWAKIGTPCTSNVGDGGTNFDNADVVYLTEQEFEQWNDGKFFFNKCVVIRAHPDDRRDPAHDTAQIRGFLKNIKIRYGSSSVEVQDLTGDEKRPVFMACADFANKITQTMDKQRRLLTKDNPPLNLLSLKAKTINTCDCFAVCMDNFIQKTNHSFRYQILPILCDRAESTLKEMTSDESKPNRIPESNAGKAKRSATLFGTPIDLQSCLEFGLYAQRGSFSGWHVDVLNGTYVKCVAGLKAWFIHEYPLTQDEKDAFARDGPHWQPDPSRVKLILLQPGETLYMPAGELIPHAPLTIFDCLMRGGMVWDMKRIKDILSNVAWVVQHSNVTNEPIPAQLIAMWDELGTLLSDLMGENWSRKGVMYPYSDAGSDSGLTDDTGSSPPEDESTMDDQTAKQKLTMEGYFEYVTNVMKEAMSCACGGKTCSKAKCPCLKNMSTDYKCTAWCHPKTKNKDPRPCMV